MPKSSSFTRPSVDTMTFDGLRSRWTTRLRVRVRHGGEHVEEEPQAGRDVEGSVVAPAVDRLALDVLEHQVGLAGLGDAGIDQLGDVGVLQTREDRALAAEAGRRPRRPGARRRGA